MADEKEKKSGMNDASEKLIVFLIALVIIVSLLSSLFRFVENNTFLSLLFRGSLFSSHQPIVKGMVSQPIGKKVTLSSNAVYYDEPGGTAIGEKKAGESATIVGGPQYYNGSRYWLVRFSDNSVGWVAEDKLTDNGSPISPGKTPVGTPILLSKDTPLSATPGGTASGSQKKGAFGTVAKGPEWANGERQWFVTFSDGSSGWVPESALSGIGPGAFVPGETPVGKSVISKGKTAVYESAGGTIVDYQPDGSPGTVIAGPVTSGGNDYWRIDFKNGTDGWVREDHVTDEEGKDLVRGNAPAAFVMVQNDVDVLLAPGGASAGFQKRGSLGVISGGPLYFNNERYWYINFQNGPDGYVAERNIRTAQTTAFDPGDTLVGKEAYTGRRAAIYDGFDGEIFAYQKAGTRGRIIRGPVFFNDRQYWYVDFETGADGYVAGDDLIMPVENSWAQKISGFLYKFSIFIILFFLTAIIYAFLRISQIQKHHRHEMELEAVKNKVKDEIPHPRWEKVLDHLSSENPNEWRLAILESDIILGEMLEKMSYGRGQTIGERLKTIEESDFHTIDKAWEAHKIRNMIAHEGSDYILTQREAKRVVSLYEEVFHEFRYV